MNLPLPSQSPKSAGDYGFTVEFEDDPPFIPLRYRQRDRKKRNRREPKRSRKTIP